MKSREELNVLKEEVETLNKTLHELTDEELEQVTGGVEFGLLRTLLGIIFEPPASMTGGHTVSE